jgi:iron complex outermembrane receptor protein
MKTKPRNARIVAAVGLVLAAPMDVQVAYAQEEAGGLETIVVTARKREENLQDVASAVSALGPSELSRRFDVDLQGFANASPNVMIDDLQQGPGSPAAISIRGIGTTDVEKSFDPTVGVVLDGVFIGVNSGAMLKALDLEGMEILRGPQGTLFGRNSIAGVVNVTRRKPESVFGGELRLGYGNYSDVQADGYVNIPVNDQLAFKLAGAKRERDGYFYNRTLGKETGKMDYRSVSPSVLWRPAEGVELYYRFDKSWQDQDANVVHNMAQPDQVFCFFHNQCAQSVKSPQSGDRYKVLQDVSGSGAYFDTDMHVLNARWDVSDDYRIEYVFGYFQTDEEVHQDWDGTPLTLYHTDRPAEYRQRSHELRLTRASDGPLTYTVGAYAWDSNYRIDLMSYIGFGDFLFGLPSGTVLNVPQSVVQDTESYAAFFEGDYRFNDQWTLTLGGRYTRDEKESGLIDPLLPELAVKGSLDNPFSESWREFTPKVSLRYRYSPDLMVYGLYTRGFRAGGFSGRPGTYNSAKTPYDPEKVDNFELGIKSEWFDRRLRLNASVYFMKYDDKQEELSVPIDQGTGQETLVMNASAAEITGLDLEILMSPFTGFTLAASLGLLDAKYKDFVDPITGRDLTYLDLRRAPELTATLTPMYEWSMFGGEMSAQASWHYVDETALTFFNSPQTNNSSQHLVDASINYQRNNTTVSIYGANLTEEDAFTVGFDVGASLDFAGMWTYAATRPPRTYGVRLVQKF